MKSATIGAVILTLVCAADVRGQSGATFSAASVRLNTSGERGGSFNGRADGGLAIRNYTLRDIISNVYGLNLRQLVVGPPWLSQTRFDIVAVTEGNPSREQRSEMARALLAARFKLVVSRQTRPVLIYGPGARAVVRPVGGKSGANNGPGPDDSGRARQSAGRRWRFRPPTPARHR